MTDTPREILLRITLDAPAPPPPARVKSILRRAMEAIPIGASAFLAGQDADQIQRLAERIRRTQPTARFTVRKQPGGAMVWRKS
jgi:hypothetical protein